MDRKQSCPARIRMSEPVWHDIAQTVRPDGKDAVQKQLDRLIHYNPSAHERILVTSDDDVIDLLRDWCAEMIVEGNKMQSSRQWIEGQTLRREARRVIDLIDRHDAKLMSAAEGLR
jgi:hypothetical protein